MCFVLLACYEANAQQDKTINLRLEQPDKVIIAEPKIIELELVQPDNPTQAIVTFGFEQDLEESKPSVIISSLDRDEVELLFAGLTDNITLDIFDVWGKLLKTERIANTSNNLTHKTVLPRTASNIYILRTKCKDFQSTHKILTKQ